MAKNRPLEVLRAIQEGDEQALSAMGKAGGRKSGELSKRRADLRALEEALRQEEQKEEFRKRDEEANLHICPLDE